MTVRLEIHEEFLSWVENHGDADRQELQKDFPNLYKTNKITVKQAEKMSKKTHIPFGYIIQDEIPDENIPLLRFRTVENKKSKRNQNLIDVIFDMQNKQGWMKEYLKNNGIDELNPLVGSLDNEETVEKGVNKVIEILGPLKLNEKDKFKRIRNQISNHGILVMKSGYVGNNPHRSLDVEQFRAFTLIDENVPLIFINNKDSKNGQLFSLIHELIHILLNRDEIFNEGEVDKIPEKRKQKEEQKINDIVANYLMPSDIFKEQFKKSSGLELNQKYQNLSKEFGVSPFAAAIQANKLGLETSSNTREIGQATKDILQEKKSSGGDYYRTKGSQIDHNFALAVSIAQENREETLTRASSLLGVSLNSYNRFVENIRESEEKQN